MKNPKLYIDPPVFYIAAFTLLAVPLQYLAQWVIAVAAHEAGHILAVLALGGRINEIRINIGGMVILSDQMTGRKSIVCSLAGPVCGAVPMLFSFRMPFLGMIAAILTLYNLLPFYPLDGGRILRIIQQEAPKWDRIICCYKIVWGLGLLVLIVRHQLIILLIPVTIFVKEIFLANKWKKGYNSATTEVRYYYDRTETKDIALCSKARPLHRRRVGRGSKE